VRGLGGGGGVSPWGEGRGVASMTGRAWLLLQGPGRGVPHSNRTPDLDDP
jgi:hypothetical protein